MFGMVKGQLLLPRLFFRAEAYCPAKPKRAGRCIKTQADFNLKFAGPVYGL